MRVSVALKVQIQDSRTELLNNAYMKCAVLGSTFAEVLHTFEVLLLHTSTQLNFVLHYII